jgi:two-component system CheB/CheR fusion protein
MDEVDGVVAGSGAPEPIVAGIGASAGGLDALQRFFAHMPGDHDLAFVVVMHRASSHANLLPDLLVRHTAMPILEASDGVVIAPRRVYLAPPASLLDIADGRLRVTRAPGVSLPIDHFFRSLARDRKEHAIGVILSGSGSDGTLGLKEIKAVSGMVMVQDVASARYAGMPHSAIATALVDYVLPAEECPGRLLRHVASPIASTDAEQRGSLTDEVLAGAVELLRTHTGYDFARYKASALQRSIERRMTVNGITSPDDYLCLLGERTAQVDALFHELLIGVTSFFREPGGFDALGGALDRLLAERPASQPVRAWVAGCATGEEAYSVAIALRESASRVDCRARLQVFATDIDDQAMRDARGGTYPESIAAELSADRLERFFTRQDGALRIRREIRDLILFCEHNLLVHPPFTRLDLICCRNVLIYLDAEAQRHALSLLAYALRPGGLLFLGSSEGLGRLSEAFERLDPDCRLFSRRPNVQIPSPPAPKFQGTREARMVARARGTAARAATIQRGLVERVLIDELVPPSVLVDQSGEIVHAHGKTARFVDPAFRRLSVSSLLEAIRPDLDVHVGAALRHATVFGESLHRGIEVRTDGAPIRIDLRARRIDSPRQLRGMILVSFEPVDEPARSAAQAEIAIAPDQMAAIRRDVPMSRSVRQTRTEDLTSREELMALNDELHTMNGEMQRRIEQLSQSSDDMLNLLNSTDIAVVFLDAELKVTRYTMQATKLFDLVPSDVGRPIADLVGGKLEHPGLLEDASEVLRAHGYKQRRVRSRDGSLYAMRVSPYRTQADRVSGVLITFLDLSKAQPPQYLEGRVLAALERLPVLIMGQDRALRVTWAYAPGLGMDGAGLVGRRDEDLMPREEAELVAAMKRRVIDTGASLHAEVEMTLPGRGLTVQKVWLEPMTEADGATSGVVSVALDITRLGRGETLLGELRAERDAVRPSSRRPRPEA